MRRDESRIIAAAFGLYPGWWRARYLDEAQSVAEDLVGDGRSPWAVATNLFIGALRARMRAAGMPLSYDAWARRTCAVVVLATSPALVVVPVTLTIRQRSLTPLPRVGPSTAAATALYLALLIGLLMLISVMVWGYFALSDGIRRPEMGNPRRLRIMARAPGYLALLGVLLFVVSAVLAPHEWRTRAGSLVSLGGHPLLSRVALDVSETAWLLCGAAAALLVLEVARRATLPLVTLSVGLVTGRVMAGLLWLMTVSATGLSLRYGTGVAQINDGSFTGGYVTVFGSGHALVILASVLGAMATVATLGAVLAGRAVRCHSGARPASTIRQLTPRPAHVHQSIPDPGRPRCGRCGLAGLRPGGLGHEGAAPPRRRSTGLRVAHDAVDQRRSPGRRDVRDDLVE